MSTLVGRRVRCAHGYRGVIKTVLNGLDEACAHKILGPLSAGARMRGDAKPCHAAVSSWLHGLSIPPKTPRNGTWYHVLCDGGGSVVAGELDVEFEEQHGQEEVPSR